MAERGGRGGRGRRGGRTFLSRTAQSLDINPAQLRKMQLAYEPEPMFPKFHIPRPTKLTPEESNAVKYYRSLRTRILEDTPFYITTRKRPAEDDEDDGADILFLPKISDFKGSHGIGISINLQRVIDKRYVAFQLVIPIY